MQDSPLPRWTGATISYAAAGVWGRRRPHISPPFISFILSISFIPSVPFVSSVPFVPLKSLTQVCHFFHFFIVFSPVENFF